MFIPTDHFISLRVDGSSYKEAMHTGTSKNTYTCDLVLELNFSRKGQGKTTAVGKLDISDAMTLDISDVSEYILYNPFLSP